MLNVWLIVLLIIAIHFAIWKDLARAVHVSAITLYVWFWIYAGFIALVVMLPIMGVGSLLGAAGGYNLFGTDLAVLSGFLIGSGISIFICLLIAGYLALCVIGARLIKIGTNFTAVKEFDNVYIFLGIAMIIVPDIIINI